MLNLEELKKLHKVAYLNQITVEENDGTERTCYLKPITLKLLDLFASKMQTDEAGALEILFTQLWVAGDEEIKSDDINYQSAIAQLQGILESDNIKWAKSASGGKYKVRATDAEGNVYNCELRHPTLHELQIQTAQHPVTTFIKLVNKIWISGDAAFTTQPSTVLALMTSLQANMERRESALKKI